MIQYENLYVKFTERFNTFTIKNLKITLFQFTCENIVRLQNLFNRY